MTRPACVIDVETTGLCPYVGYGMVEFSAIVFDLDDPGLKTLDRITVSVDPGQMGSDLLVSEEALKYSQKAYDSAKLSGVNPCYAAERIFKFFAAYAPFKLIPFGQNTTFDLNFLKVHIQKWIDPNLLLDQNTNPYLVNMRPPERDLFRRMIMNGTHLSLVSACIDFMPWSRRYVDLQSFAVAIWHNDDTMKSYSLNSIAKKLKVITKDRDTQHSSIQDCEITLACFRQLKKAGIIA